MFVQGQAITDISHEEQLTYARCIHPDCGEFLGDHDNVLDHVEANPAHLLFVEVTRPRLGDHVFINTIENARYPWLSHHHGVVVSEDSAGTIRISHFDCCCSSNEPAIIESTFLAFSQGKSVFLYPNPKRRLDPVRFARACLGKSGYDARSFNCEHFASLCVQNTPVAPMSDRSFLIAAGVAGTAFTVLGGAAGAALWMVGKTALIGKVLYDQFKGTARGTDPDKRECCICRAIESVVVISRCAHAVCTACVSRSSDYVVCPVKHCFQEYFEFKIGGLGCDTFSDCVPLTKLHIVVLWVADTSDGEHINKSDIKGTCGVIVVKKIATARVHRIF
jgi:hypothetical protein